MINQLYKLYNCIDCFDDKKRFIERFNNLSFELDELGWRDKPDELIYLIITREFNLSIDDEKQLSNITEYILNKNGIDKLKVFHLREL